MKKEIEKGDIKNLTFEQEKELIKMRNDSLLLEHKLKLERFAYERESARIFHDLALQRERIKSAERRRSIDRKEWSKFGSEYVRELPK